jgi:putative ABC transport system permease protein
VGVVGDIKHDGLDDEAYPAVYSPYTQKPMAWKRSFSVVLRTKAVEPMAAAQSLKNAVWKIDPQLPVTFIEPMDQVMAASVSQQRFSTVLLCIFAGLALTLAVVGIYGVTAYVVAQRTQEIGIRMALGAQPRSVLRMIIAEGVGLSAMGVVLGIVGALALARLVKGLLFQVESTDPIAFLSSAGLLVLVALIASYFPARRAAKVDPMSALRTE